MNIGLFKSTFDINFAAAPSLVGEAEKLPAVQPVEVESNIAKPTKTPREDRSDNSPPSTQDKPVTEPSETFSQTLDNKIGSKTPQDAQPAGKTEKRTKNPETPSKNVVLVVQNAMTQPLLVARQIGTKVNENTKNQAENQALLKPKNAQVVPISESAQALPINNQVAKAVTANPDQTAPANSTLVDKAIKPVINQPHLKSFSSLPAASDKTPISNGQAANGKNVAKPRISDEIVATNKPIAANSGAVAGEKPVTIAKNKLADAYGLNTSDKSGITAKPVTDSGGGNELIRKTLISAQSSQNQQKSPIPVAGNITPGKTDTSQKDHSGKTQIFESPDNKNIQPEAFSVKPVPQKTSQTQAAVLQVENRSNLLVDKAAGPKIELGEQVLVSNNAQSGNTEQTANLPELMKVAGNTNSDNTVSRQILESVQSSSHTGNQQIVIRLDPPELGKVAITFTEKGDDITGVLQVDKLQTKNQIQQQLPEIIHNLQNSGVQIKRIEVVLTNNQDQYASKDQSSTAGQGSFSEHQNSSKPESQTNNTTYNEWLTNNEYGTQFNETQAYITDKSVNMLV